MALKTSKGNHLMPLRFKGLNRVSFALRAQLWQRDRATHAPVH